MKKKVLAIIMVIIMGLAVLSGCTSAMANLNKESNKLGTEDINNQSEDQNEQEGQKEQEVEGQEVQEVQEKQEEGKEQYGETNETGAEVIDNLSQAKNKQEEQEEGKEQFVLENEAFRIYEPAPNEEIKDSIVVRGLARVFEATVQYEFEDGHNILDKGFTTASEGAPGWGEFEIVIKVDKTANGLGTIILYEESAEDGSRLHELLIPVTVAD